VLIQTIIIDILPGLKVRRFLPTSSSDAG